MITFFSSSGRRPFELLPSLGIRRLLTFYIWIFSSETALPNDPKLGWKHLWKDSLWRLLILSWSIYKHGRHRQLLFLVGKFLKIFFSEAASPNEPILGRKHQWKFLYKECSFCHDSLTNMVAIGNSCFWLVDF